MRAPQLSFLHLCLALGMGLAGSFLSAAPGTAFSYQGRLLDTGEPAAGEFDIEFALWDAATSGTQIGATISIAGLAVADGLFEAELDFGAGAFDGEARWLEIALRPADARGDAFTSLAPRRAIAPAPQAQYALLADSAINDATADADADPANEIQTLAFDAPNLTISGDGGNGVDLSALQDGTGADWSRTGNAGTNPSTHFLGTTDNTALELRVDNRRVFRIEPAVGSIPNSFPPNLIGGVSANGVSANVSGAVIGGGGEVSGPPENSLLPNRVTDHYGTIGGGVGNLAGNDNVIPLDATHSVVGGGARNTASGMASMVGGGSLNVASGARSSVAGGQNNTAGAPLSTIGGGLLNQAGALYATVPGGDRCHATGTHSFAAGRQARAGHSGAFVWADSQDATFSSTAINQFLIRAAGGVGIGTASPGLGAILHAVHGTQGTTSWGVRIENSTQAGFEGGIRLSNGGFLEITNTADSASPNFARLSSAGTWTAVSDERMKEEIEPLEGALDKALALEPVSYRYKAGPPERRIGFTAQNVEGQFPSLVETGDDLKTLDYGGLSVVAIAALRELKAEKDAEIRALRERLDALEAKLGER